MLNLNCPECKSEWLNRRLDVHEVVGNHVQIRKCDNAWHEFNGPKRMTSAPPRLDLSPAEQERLRDRRHGMIRSWVAGYGNHPGNAVSSRVEDGALAASEFAEWFDKTFPSGGR